MKCPFCGSVETQVIDWKRFKEIADSVGALLMVDMAHYAGLVAADVYPSPVGIAFLLTVMCASDSSASASLPVIFLARRSTRNM